MRILNPEIEAHINALPDTYRREKKLLKDLLVFEHEHSDKANYAFKQEILQMVEEVLRDFPDDTNK